jgi:methionine biosynthesis protein MetW
MTVPMSPSNASFEDARWARNEQKIEYRHVAASSLVPSLAENLLDVGCGDGTLLSLIRSQRSDLQLTGVDFSIVGLAEARKKVPDASYLQVDANEAFPFADNTFDVVTVLDVLEHFLEPEKILIEAARVSKKYVIVSVPNFSSLPARLQVVFGTVPENNRPNKGHMYWFNRTALYHLLSQTRLDVITERSNVQLERIPFVGGLFKLARTLLPGLFALSFVTLAQKR